MTTPPSTKTIVIVGFDGVQMLDVTGPADVFAKAEQLRPGSYRLLFASPRGGAVTSNSGLTLAHAIRLDALPANIDTLLVTGADKAGLRRAVYDEGLANWIALAAPNIRRIGSVCTGAFALAASGLLDGRRATTHGHSCDLLQKMCPSAKVQTDIVYTVDAPIYTSAGVTAGIDLALALVEEDYGRAIAAETARELVLFVRRPGSQSQHSISLAAQANASNKLRDLIVWIVDNPGADLSVSALAGLVGMSERNFSRVFAKEAGCTPASFVEQTRFDHARDLLEHSDWPLDRVAERSGFGSNDALQRQFQQKLGLTPASYRKDVARPRSLPSRGAGNA